MREGLRSSTLAKRRKEKDDSDLSVSTGDGKSVSPVTPVPCGLGPARGFDLNADPEVSLSGEGSEEALEILGGKRNKVNDQQNGPLSEEKGDAGCEFTSVKIVKEGANCEVGNAGCDGVERQMVKEEGVGGEIENLVASPSMNNHHEEGDGCSEELRHCIDGVVAEKVLEEVTAGNTHSGDQSSGSMEDSARKTHPTLEQPKFKRSHDDDKGEEKTDSEVTTKAASEGLQLKHGLVNGHESDTGDNADQPCSTKHDGEKEQGYKVGRNYRVDSADMPSKPDALEGYKVKHEGCFDSPKGKSVAEDNTDDMKDEPQDGEVQMVGRVLRPRVAVTSPEEITCKKRKRGDHQLAHETAGTNESDCDQSVVGSTGMVKGKRGRPRKIIDGGISAVKLTPQNAPGKKKKDGRGRPRKMIGGSAEVNLTPQNASTEKKKDGRGRPRKMIDDGSAEMNLTPQNAPTEKKKDGRGRPRKVLDANDEVNLTPQDAFTKKKKDGRGRPRKRIDSSDLVNMTPQNASAEKKKDGRGRPKKKVDENDVMELKLHNASVNVFPKKHGRPEKITEETDAGDVVNMTPQNTSAEKKKDGRGRPKKKVDENDAVELKLHNASVFLKKRGRLEKITEVTDAGDGMLAEKNDAAGTSACTSEKGVYSRGVSGSKKIKFTEVKMKGAVNPSGSRQKRNKGSIDALSAPCKDVVKIGRRSEKEEIRREILTILERAGWTVQYRPRLGKEYQDPVYVNPKGKTHWSITLAYRNFKKQVETGEVGSDICFTPIPEERLSKLYRTVINKRGDKGKPKVKGSSSKAGPKSKHASAKMKPSSARSGPKNKRRCALMVRSASQGSDLSADGCISLPGKHSVLSWMIERGSVSLGGKVCCHRTTEVMLEGIITRDGICCGCCNRILSVVEFERHAGGKSSQPCQNVFIEDGSTLLQCQLDSWSKQERSGPHGFHDVRIEDDDPNDDTCALCGDGGDLICCDGCSSTFHQDCLNIESFPPDEWHCVYCSCKFCGTVAGDALDEEDCCDEPSSSLLTCSLCEEKYHQPCIGDEGAQDVQFEGLTFCGRSCKEIFEQLQMLVGVKRDLEDGYTWTLLKRYDLKSNNSMLEPVKVESNSKLAVAYFVMDECFLPIIDHRSGINLIHNILYSCGSNFNRLNYRGFYTIILERGDEVIAAASIRIHGKQLAEMPFIGTRHAYRRQGMCSRLLSAIESALGSLQVEKLVIPAISEMSGTWTSVFKFRPLEASSKEQLRHVNMLVFPGTDMLQKPICGNQAATERIFPVSDGDAKASRSVSDGGNKSEVGISSWDDKLTTKVSEPSSSAGQTAGLGMINPSPEASDDKMSKYPESDAHCLNGESTTMKNEFLYSKDVSLPGCDRLATKGLGQIEADSRADYCSTREIISDSAHNASSGAVGHSDPGGLPACGS